MNGARQLAASVPIRTASGGVQVAIPILAVEVMGDVGLGAMLVALALLPSIVAAPAVGAILDSVKTPRVPMIASAVATGAIFAIAGGLGILPTWLIAVLLALSGLLSPFGFGGLSSFVGHSGRDAHRAYALDSLSYNISGVAGPALVAVLAPTVGSRVAMFVMAAIVLVSAVTYPLMPMASRKSATNVGLLKSMAGGVVAIMTQRKLTTNAWSGALAELGRGMMPIAAVGIAIAATGDAAMSAVIVAGFAVGALVGALVETARSSPKYPERAMLVGFGLSGISMILAAIDFGFVWTIVFVALSGAFNAPAAAAMLLMRRKDSPPEVVGQVFTLGAAMRTAASAIGTAIAGMLAGLDPLWVLALGGLVWVVGASLMFFYPRAPK
ncbi:MFS transporter [Gulosibacter chungangensis]|uniref:MFS transporter n=1 Tax=Gulosibacter chungangensis TaxID=979746 RepID=A0A7J5B9Y1_9MICO|nr:MFS transporter [Gulosibacter chungangensis]KAB1642568.1 MFS transporter [Gulosibacter chungangensis]